MQNQFVINERFGVNEAVNTITDLETRIETRLEPRLMKLIMLLVMHKGEVVTRQKIITDVWDDYGNADEGLSHAVSFLRKILADTDKQLIRTISKKGYILDATVSANAMVQPFTSPNGSRKPGKVYLYIIIPIIIVIVIAGTYFLISRIPSKTPIEPPGTAIDTIYQHQEMKESANQKEQKDMETEKKIYKEKD